MTIGTPQLQSGARELIDRCLAVGPEDVVLVLTDDATASLAAFISAAAADRAPTELVIMPSVDADPEAALAAASLAIERIAPTVTVFAARDEGDRFAWDDAFGALRADRGIRHAHMPALDAESLGIGMATDYEAVAAFTALIAERVAGAREVTIVNDLGTDIRFTLDPDRPWTGFDGIYARPGEGGRLPQGEVFCSPLTADGVIAASVLGYPFNASTGLLADPVRFEVRGGAIAGIEHPDGLLRERLRAWFGSDEHGGRVGELAFGTNRHSHEVVGNLLFDENVPGCHIAFGHPFGDYTGADWTSGIHVDVVVRQPTITVDGVELIVDGTYAATIEAESEEIDPQ